MAEHVPTLSIHREVLNISEFDFEAIHAEALNVGIPPSKIRMPSPDVNKAIIITPGDILGFLRKNAITSSLDEIEQLGDFLNQQTPDSGDTDLEVFSFPLGERWMHGRSNVRLLSAGHNNPKIREERRQLTGLIEHFYEVAPQEGMWPNWDYMSEVWLARVQGRDNAKKVSLLRRAMPLMIPKVVTLGTVVTDSYKYDGNAFGTAKPAW